jgi:hypothetical protein
MQLYHLFLRPRGVLVVGTQEQILSRLYIKDYFYVFLNTEFHGGYFVDKLIVIKLL